MKDMNLKAIAAACGGEYRGDGKSAFMEVSSVVIDSRKVEKGSLFIAIRGARSDGHDYVGQAYQKGALCCITEKEIIGTPCPYIRVPSSLAALREIAAYYRSRLLVKIVGVTGSVGKTSTKETIAAVLARKYRVLKTQGNFNNEIGLPLTIFSLSTEDEVGVLEMGISDFGEMDRLAAIARPDLCVITNIGSCHLENLHSRDGVLKAKTEIFGHMNPKGTVILNGDDDKLSSVRAVCGKPPVFFGLSRGFLRKQAVGVVTYGRVDFMMKENGSLYCLEVNTLPGMTSTSLLPQEAAVLGVSYEQLCADLIRISLKKYDEN